MSEPCQGVATSVAPTNAAVLLLRDIALTGVAALLARYDLRLQLVGDDAPIPGSYWGEPEAGLIGTTVYARNDTPVHSLLHEAAHLIVLDPDRRAAIHTNATDSVEEEDAVCVLQSVLGDALPGVGAERVLADMDAWGYTFRLGSAHAYVMHDAEAAWQWLSARGLLMRSLRVRGSMPASNRALVATAFTWEIAVSTVPAMLRNPLTPPVVAV